MDDTKTEIIKQICTGDWKAIPVTMGLKFLNEHQFTQIFVDAGKQIREFRRYGTEETELRNVIFCEENMKLLAKHMRPVDDYTWLERLVICVDNLVNGSAMSEDNKETSKQRFVEIVTDKCRKILPEIYGRSRLEEIGQGMEQMNSRMDRLERATQNIIDMGSRQNQEERLQQRMETEKRPETEKNMQQNGPTDIGQIAKWDLSDQQVEGLFGPKENRYKDISQLTEAWKKERNVYPGWYILPYNICAELSSKTREEGLLQSHTFVDLNRMFLFAYELAWRYEKCMHLYSDYEIHHLSIIWDNYYEKEIKSWSHESAIYETENIKKWFYIGQVLLRVYREEGRTEAWKNIYTRLKAYESYGVNGTIDLQLEKAKQEYHRLQIPAMRRSIAHCHPNKEHYEQRLQILGLQAELDELESVIPALQQLMQDIQDAEISNGSNGLYFKTLRVSILQLYMLCVQGKWDYTQKFEIHLQEIHRIQEDIDSNCALFDWEMWKDNVQHKLLRWHVRKYEQREAFPLNQEYRTIIQGTGNACEPAYHFYRLLDKLALPLKCGYVTLLGDLEQPWIEAVLEQMDYLGLFLLCRGCYSRTIETLVDRAWLCTLSPDVAGNMVAFLIHALSDNMEEMSDQERPQAGGILTQIFSNVPELLIRFMSRCPDAQQEDALLLAKQLMESEELPVSFSMAELGVGIMENVSEAKKSQMLDVMLQTKIVEHKTMHGHGDGIDIFSYYFRKEDIGPLQRKCIVRPETIAWLLEIPSEAGYEWRTKVLRLETLYRLQLLDEKQQQAYAALLWHYVSETTGLPEGKDLHLFAYEKLPCLDANIPVKSIKQWFLSRRLQDQFEDQQGCRSTMGKIPYLDELVLVCENMEPGYWSQKETEQLLQDMQAYWCILRGKLEQVRPESFAADEFRNRAQKIEKTAAALCRNTGMISTLVSEQLQSMLQEMCAYNISIKELEIQIANSDALAASVCEEMQSSEKELTIGAQTAAYQYIMAHPTAEEAQVLLNEFLNILRYRKTPGLVSAIYFLHNLVYADCQIIRQRDNQNHMDACLEMLADILRVEQDCDMPAKDILHARKACMSLAFRMYQMPETSGGKGVQRWKEIAADECEMNEIRQEWVW